MTSELQFTIVTVLVLINEHRHCEPQLCRMASDSLLVLVMVVKCEGVFVIG